jgi:hypothetical protein
MKTSKQEATSRDRIRARLTVEIVSTRIELGELCTKVAKLRARHVALECDLAWLDNREILDKCIETGGEHEHDDG